MYSFRKLNTIEELTHRNPSKNFFPFIKFLDESPEGREFVKKYRLKKVPKGYNYDHVYKMTYINLLYILPLLIFFFLFIFSQYIGITMSILSGIGFFVSIVINVLVVHHLQLLKCCDLAENHYFKVYKEKKEIYIRTTDFVKLLVEKTIDAPTHEKSEFLNKYQDKKILKKCKNRSEKLYAPETDENDDL
jgi:hypothetical protein